MRLTEATNTQCRTLAEDRKRQTRVQHVVSGGVICGVHVSTRLNDFLREE